MRAELTIPSFRPVEASFAAAIDKVFGAAARERIVAVYPASAYASPRAAFAQLTTDAEFTCQSRRVARALTRRNGSPSIGTCSTIR
jgi:carboxylesterase type B